jgi:hypothetical protein
VDAEFLTADNAEKRGDNLFGKASNSFGGRRFSVENYIDENRVVAAPILSKTMIDAGNLRVIRKKLLKLVDSFPDFVLVNQSWRYDCHDISLLPWYPTEGCNWGPYSWHGYRVPDWVVLDPQRLTVDAILSEQSPPLRTAMVEQYGEHRFLRETGIQIMGLGQFRDTASSVGASGLPVLIRFKDEFPVLYVVRKSGRCDSI